MDKVFNYLTDVRLELSKVVWPSKEEVVRLTLTVIIVTAIVSGYIGALDYIFVRLLELFISA